MASILTCLTLTDICKFYMHSLYTCGISMTSLGLSPCFPSGVKPAYMQYTVKASLESKAKSLILLILLICLNPWTQNKDPCCYMT